MGDNWTIEIPIFTLAVIGLVANLISLLYRVVRSFTLPKLWKYSLVSIDAAHIFLGIGLVLQLIYKITNIEILCKSISFFLQFGLFDCASGYLIASFILLFILNPGKSSNLSTFHRNVFLVIFIPQKIISITLSLLPITPVSIFDQDTVNTISCFKLSQQGEKGFSYGVLGICICVVCVVVSLICCFLSVVKLSKGISNRIHSASPNVWQAQIISQGRQLQKLLIVEIIAWIITLTVLIVINYTTKSTSKSAAVLIVLGITTILHGILTNIGNSMWSICCCTSSQTIEETHRKLKQLELVKLEAPGKLRLRATWNAGKHHTRQGLMKVYGPKHVKNWAQEIVVLGMLRKIQHASLLQCLWTSSSNPYYETMTLITGEIVTSDSRIICLELTNSGTLQDMIRRLETPLPEACQRMIIHDIAEGLYYLHDQNILHNNLNSSCIYLKGSLPSMVMRAAIGDFEDTLIFGAMQQSTGHTVKDKRNFFLPDIRSFALIALEVISNMCEKKFATYQYEWEQYLTEEAHKKGQHYYPSPYYNDSDFEDEFYRHQPAGVRSPGEVIEDYKRSRSMSPGSRPLSAQSIRSQRSRTLSPDMTRSHHSPAVTLFESRAQTPEPMSKRSRSKSPFSRKHKKKNRAPDPSDFSHRDSPAISHRDSPAISHRDSPLVLEGEKQIQSNTPTKQKQSDPLNTSDSTKPQGKTKLKKVDSKKWMISKFRTLTGSETTVSAFKPKSKCEYYDSNDEVSDEEIQTMRQRLQKKKRTDSKSSSGFENDLHKSLSNYSSGSHPLYELQGMHPGQKIHRKLSDQSLQRTMSGEMNVHRTLSGGLENQINRTASGSASIEKQIHRTFSGKSESQVHRTMSNHSDQWSILSDMEYPRSHGLRNTISQDSRASLWSNLPLPVEMIEENYEHLDAIIDCLPGMAETASSPLKRNTQNREYLTMRDKSLKHKDYWRNDGPGTQRFELVDYYDELQGKYVKRMAPHPFYRSSSGSNILPKPVHRTFSGPQILHRTSSGLHEIIEATEVSENEDIENFKHDLDLAHKELGTKFPAQFSCNPGQKIKPVFINEEAEKIDEKPKELIKPNKSKKKRSKSAEKPSASKMEEHNESKLTRSESQRKKSQARSALQKKLSSKAVNMPVVPNSEKREKANLQIKYANVKKLKTQSNENVSFEETHDNKQKSSELEDVHNSNFKTYEKFKSGVSRYSSFSSNDSGSSIDSSVRIRKADVSLTSGELTSLSSQADVDTDGHTTDLDLPFKQSQMRKNLQSRARISDSGFDSESSEICSEVYRSQKAQKLQSLWKKEKSQSQRSIPVEDLPYVSVDTGKTNLSETAFVLTGFENKPSTSQNLFGAGDHDIDEELLPDNDFVPPHEEEDSRPVSRMSRIIEVTSASPEDIKDFNDTNRFSNKNLPSVSKSMDTRTKTPSQKTTTAKEVRGPNVYASQVVATKRYKELTKKGVPLRVSVISSDSPKVSDKGQPELVVNETEDSGNVSDDQKLFQDLESNGFFKSNVNSNTLSPPHRQNRKSRKDQPKRKRVNKVPLNDIIREIPEESRSPSSSNNRSPAHQKSFLDESFHNHSGEEAMLNQPHTSEDSETASVHNSNANSVPSAGMPKQHQPSVVVDAELYIDRVYSNKPVQSNQFPLLDPDFDSPLTYERLYQPMNNDLCINDDYNENVDLDIDIPLLEGMNERHVVNLRKMTTQLNLVSFHDLLPANVDSFSMLKTKLQQGGQLGNIGTQLLEIIHSCWLNDLPPTSFDLVLQLTDPVTETEL